MQLVRFDDVTAFFGSAGGFLEAREAEHNLLLGFRTRLERNPQVFGDGDLYLGVVERDGEVVAVGFQSPPYNPVLSETDDLEAVDHIASDLIAERELGGVTGPVGATARFAAVWRSTTSGAAQVAMAQRIYESTESVRPTGVSGRPRRYQAEDRDLVIAWLEAFVAEAEPPGHQTDAASMVDRRVADPDGDFVLWEDGGSVVSVAGFGGATPNGIRVGPVYTPPELRGRGYASAVTADVTARLLAGGRRFCFLFTDLANATSNSIYQRIGYRPVADVSQWVFERA